VASALAAIPNDNAVYDDWLFVGLALHSTEQPWARDLWDRWSQQSDKFDEGKQAKSWSSFVSSGPVQIGTLFHMAKQRGWTPPRPLGLRTTTWAPPLTTVNAQEVPSCL
jgi:hypothetical protein